MKNEFKGTKGEWRINPRASRNIKCGEITIANCSGGQCGDNQEQEEANAKLISCAPKLLVMLQKFLDEFEYDNATEYECNLFFDAKKLIQKATT